MGNNQNTVTHSENVTKVTAHMEDAFNADDTNKRKYRNDKYFSRTRSKGDGRQGLTIIIKNSKKENDVNGQRSQRTGISILIQTS